MATLPQATLTPEMTEGRDGFIHLTDMTGSAAEARLRFILRDFERDGLAAKGALLAQVCAAVQATEPRAQIAVTINPQYRNMRDGMEKEPRAVPYALEAVRRLRPRFLTSRGSGSVRNANAGSVHLSVDGGPLQTVNFLSRMRPGEIAEIRFLNATDAALRFGTAAGSGSVILVRTR